MLSSQPNAKFVRNSNSTTAPSRGHEGYRNSETHHQRQYYGPTSADPAYGDAMVLDPPSYNPPPMRYPGTGNSGYNGVNSASYVAQQQRYEAQQNAYNPTSAAQYSAAQQSYSPAPQAADMYGAGMPVGAAAMVPQAAFGQPAGVDAQYVRGAAYSQNAMNPMATTSGPNRSVYPTAAPVYASAADYGGYAQSVGASGAAAAYAQPIDARYGRGSSSQQQSTIPAPSDYLASPAGNQPQTGYSTVLPESQYDETQTQAQSQSSAQAPSRNSVTPASSSQAQISSSGQTTSSSTTTTNTRRDREDRHRREDRDRDTTDRHASERHARRHGAR